MERLRLEAAVIKQSSRHNSFKSLSFGRVMPTYCMNFDPPDTMQWPAEPIFVSFGFAAFHASAQRMQELVNFYLFCQALYEGQICTCSNKHELKEKQHGW